MWYKIVMSSEGELRKIISGVGSDELEDYEKLRHQGRFAMSLLNRQNLPNGEMGEFFEEMRVRDNFARSIMACSLAVARAAIVSMVAEQNGWVGTRKSVEAITEIFPREHWGFVLEAQAMLGEVVVRTSGKYTSLSVDGMALEREKKLGSTQPELLAVLGLNASGKTTVIRALQRFSNSLGLRSTTVKFPRYDPAESPFADLISSGLRGEKHFGGVAFQLLFLADMFNFLESLDASVPLYLSDRFPVYDGQVYSPDASKLISLWAEEGIDIPVTAVIVDRHPAACRKRLIERGNKGRIFEKSVEMMAAQQVEFLRLLSLGGVGLVNADVHGDERPFWAGWRVIEMTCRQGVWERALMRSGMISDWNKARAHVKRTADALFFSSRQVGNAKIVS